MLTCRVIRLSIGIQFQGRRNVSKVIKFTKNSAFFYHCVYFKEKEDRDKNIILSASQHLTPDLISVKLLRVMLPSLLHITSIGSVPSMRP